MDVNFTDKEYNEQTVVYIGFFGTQLAITQTDSITMPLTRETRVYDAIKYTRQRYPSLNLDEGIMITVNQSVASPDEILMANDTISFLPLISGG